MRASRFQPHSLSNIELLVPLMMSDASEDSDESDTSAASERYDRARVDKDTPFSNIPSSAFVLDESPPAASHKHKRGHKQSRKQDLAYRPRSIYLESIESDGRDEHSEQVDFAVEIARACSRLMRSATGHQHELLLVLCSELLDSATAHPAPDAPAACVCHRQDAAPLRWEPLVRLRRDLVPIGENSDW